MKITKFLWSIPLLLAFIQPVMATTTGMVGSTMTSAGPLNILLSLGIENIPGVSVDYAFTIYKVISFAIIMLIAMSSDRKTQDIFSIIIVACAAIFSYFGWWNILMPDGSINQVVSWSMVIFCALIAVVSYMTSQNQINFGISGAGDPVIKLFMFFVIFSSCLGMISSTQIFAAVQGVPPAPPICTNNDYTNCQVSGATELASIGSSNSAGGLFSNLGNYATMFVSAGYNMIMLMISMILSLVCVAATLLIVYPWLWDSPPAMIMLGLLQMGIYVLYVLMIMRWTAKTMPGEARL